MRRILATLCLSLLCAALLAVAPAAADQTNARVPANKAIVDQKTLLVENMAYRSIAAKTISESGDAKAMDALAEAKALIEDAKKAGARGDYAGADGKLNAALKLINDHSRRLSLDGAEAERAEEIFKRRRHAVETFLKAHERVAADPDADASKKSKEHAAWIAERLAEADALAAKGKHEEAQKPLEAAYERTRGLIRSMRAGQTLTRTLNFETAEEEYAYELKRNDSHFALLEFAIVEKNPRGSVVQRIQQNRDSARKTRGSAETLAKQGDFPGAITELNTSTNTLLKAIRMSGIFIPG